MKFNFTFFFILLISTIVSQNNTLLRIENPNNKTLLFIDYETMDTVFRTSKSFDTIIDNDSYFRTLIVEDENIKTKFNELFLSEDTIDANFKKDYIINFKRSILNKEYQNFIKQLEVLKKENKPIDSLVYNFHFKHNDLYVSLDFIYNASTFNMFSKDSLVLFFNNLDHKLKRYSLWQECDSLLKNNITKVQENEVLKEYELIDTSFHKVKLRLDNYKEALIIFWASWCKPCLKEISLLKKTTLKKDYQIILLNLDDKEKWSKSIKINQLEKFQNYNLEGGFANTMAREFGVIKIPFNIKVDENKIIEKLSFNLFAYKTKNDTFYYKEGDFSLTNSQKDKLKNLLDEIKVDFMDTLSIYSYASSLGEQSYNYTLSRKRSENIKAILIEENPLIENKIKIKNFGEIESFETDKSIDRKTVLKIKYYVLNKNIFEFEDLYKLKIKQKLILDKIYFVGNKEYVLPESFNELRRLKNFLKFNPNVEIEIQGHVDLPPDWKGGDYTNLSTRRAKYIYNYLIKAGIDEKRLKYIGLGGKYPIYDSNSKKSFLNRRVEILRTK